MNHEFKLHLDTIIYDDELGSVFIESEDPTFNRPDNLDKETYERGAGGRPKDITHTCLGQIILVGLQGAPHAARAAEESLCNHMDNLHQENTMNQAIKFTNSDTRVIWRILGHMRPYTTHPLTPVEKSLLIDVVAHPDDNYTTISTRHGISLTRAIRMATKAGVYRSHSPKGSNTCGYTVFMDAYRNDVLTGKCRLRDVCQKLRVSEGTAGGWIKRSGLPTTRALSRARNLKILEYESTHPNETLKSIGIKFGFPTSTAKSMVSKMLTNSGRSRPLGMGSPAFDRSKHYTKYDYDAIWACIQANPDMSYADIGKMHDNCDPGTVAKIARSHGLHIGKHSPESMRRLRAKKRIQSVDAMREFFSTPRPLPMRMYAEELEYASEKTLRVSLKRLGITRRMA